MTDFLATIGELAGKVWRHLAAEGEQSLPSLVSGLETDPERLTLAIGWLAREGKITLRKAEGTIVVALKENAESW
jgi:hypothetical protein